MASRSAYINIRAEFGCVYVPIPVDLDDWDLSNEQLWELAWSYALNQADRVKILPGPPALIKTETMWILKHPAWRWRVIGRAHVPRLRLVDQEAELSRTAGSGVLADREETPKRTP